LDPTKTCRLEEFDPLEVSPLVEYRSTEVGPPGKGNVMEIGSPWENKIYEIIPILSLAMRIESLSKCLLILLRQTRVQDTQARLWIKLVR
jgi:hypothetical protein